MSTRYDLDRMRTPYRLSRMKTVRENKRCLCYAKISVILESKTTNQIISTQ